MTDAAARATRFDSESTSASAPAYLWAPPLKPVSVAIPLTVIDQLEHAAVESFRSLSSRGSEIGGVLFGRWSPGSPLTVTIESFLAVECDYSAGPLYRLSAAELARLDRAIEQRAASGARAVGFYRSHTRKGLALDADDLALLESRFREPHHIALLIRPAATRASVAGIFIREDGQVHGEASCLEFPFRSSQHEGVKLTEGLYDGAVAGPRSVNAAPAAPRPATRAQIVPIASRREIAPEAPLPAPSALADAPPPQVEMMVEPASEPLARKAAEPAPKQEPAPADVSAPAAEPKPATPAAEPEAMAQPEAAFAAADEPAAPVKTGSRKLLWLLIGAAASVALAVGLVLSSGILHRGRVIPTGQDTLNLRVDRNGTDVVLTWNRDSDAIRHATRAVLSINDGPQHENVEMDVSQLRTGSIVYPPVTGDVVFRLEVSGPKTPVSESVRVLGSGRPSPMPTDPSQDAKATPKIETPAAPSAEPAPAAAPEPEKPVALAQAVKPFQAESLAQRLRPASPTELPDAPMMSAPMPAPTAGVNLSGIVSTQAPAPAPSAPKAASPIAAAEKKGGQIVQAQLIRRRDPEYPKIARDSGAGGVVELLATVGTDGKVKAVQVVRGHPLLRQPASDAVKTWLYRPCMLNGVAVETQTQILLNFKSER